MLLAIVLILLIIVALLLAIILTTRMVRVVNSSAQPVPVSGTASITGPVTVGNPPTNPVPVWETVRRELQPFSHSFGDLGFNNGEDQRESTRVFIVPAKKRLVLEDVWVGTHLDKGQRVELNLLRIGVDGGENRHGIAVSYQVTHNFGTFFGDFFAGGRPIRIYLEAGEKLTASARRDSTVSGAFIDMYVYGYFVDVP
jgi:hypothetical protein